MKNSNNKGRCGVGREGEEHKRLNVSYSKYQERASVKASDKTDGKWVEGKKQTKVKRMMNSK